MAQYVGVIEKMVFGGDGFLKNEEGIAIFLPKGITGQKVLYHVPKKKKNFWQGEIIEVLEPSPLEIPFTERKNPLPGCVYQNIRYADQLLIKDAQLKEIFRNFDVEFLPIKASPEIFSYRNKMEFSFGFSSMKSEIRDGKKHWKDEGFALGFHPPKNWASVISIPDVFIASPSVNFLREILEKNIPLLYPDELPWNALSRKGFFRGVIFRESRLTKMIQVNLVVSAEKPLEYYQPLQNLILNTALPEAKTISGIVITVHTGQNDAITDPKTSLLWGLELLQEDLCGRHFEISPFSFFQTNTLGAEVLYSTIEQAVGDIAGKTVLDLFCGTGSIGIFCAKDAKKVIGVEMVKEAVEVARKNAEKNGLKNAVFYAGKAEKILPDVLADHTPSSVIIDPPRAGMHPDALEMVAHLQVPKMVYVSCNPSTLARDAEYLEKNGWKLKTIQAIDMFPHTPHVEVVSVFEK